MRSKTLRNAVGPTLICAIGLYICGCRQQEGEAPAPERKEESSAGYEEVLPRANLPAGWELTEPVNVYAGKKLYDSIDGAADRFFQYDFREQYVATYSRQDADGRIQVEVYDMGTPDDAFGIFTCHDNIMSRHAKIGLAAVVSDINLDFCQGKYFMRLLAFDFDGGQAEQPLRDLAETIARNITPASGRPELVQRLPEGIVEGTVLYFHAWPILNERRYVADENVLNLNEKTNAVLAAYTSQDQKTEDMTFKLAKDVMFLIEYPSGEDARAARTDYITNLQKIVKASLAEGEPPAERLKLIGLPQEPMELYQVYKGEEGEMSLTSIVRVFRNYILGIWDITDETKAKELVKTLASNLTR